MFGDGWTEILIIVIVATVVIGPKDLPRVIRMVGRFIGMARNVTGNVQGQMRELVRQAEIEASIGEVRRAVDGTGSAMAAALSAPAASSAASSEGGVSALRQDLAGAFAPLLQPATGSGYVFPKLDSRPLLLYPKAASYQEDAQRVPDLYTPKENTHEEAPVGSDPARHGQAEISA